MQILTKFESKFCLKLENAKKMAQESGKIFALIFETFGQIDQEILPLDGFLNQVYKCGEHYLLLFNNSNIALYENGKVLLNAKLSGPINYAEWSESEQGWHIAGWRELVFISTEKQNRIQLKELAVFVDSQNGLYLCNDGKWDIIDSTEEQ